MPNNLHNMTKKNNKSLFQTLMSFFKTQTKKAHSTNTKMTKVKKTKRAKLVMKGGMLRDGTVVRNMPKQS